MVRLKELRAFKGTVHWHQNDTVIRSIGPKLDISQDNGRSFSRWCELSSGGSERLFSASGLGRRFFRANLKHVENLGESNKWVIVDRYAVWLKEAGSMKARLLSRLHGSRPLRIVANEGRLMYGEYWGNKTRGPIRLWESNDGGLDWVVAHEFSSIRHIHGVFEDPYDCSVWVTTGDLDRESAIWRFESNIKYGKKILWGCQDYRVIDLVFQKDAIYFASDAPERPNAIFRWCRTKRSVERLQEIGGPAFHARNYGEHIVFTTVREPSVVNVEPYSEMWMARGSEDWRCALRVRKDMWPMKAFQYGQIPLPSGGGSADGFWFSTLATELDQRSFFLPFQLIGK